MDELASELQRQGLMRCDRRELYRYRQFYLTYPQIVEAVPPQLLPGGLGGATAQSSPTEPVHRPTSPIKESAIPQLLLPGRKLVESLSFTHFVELVAIDDPLKRAFYEIECLRGDWSVRELKRQIGSLYFERSGLSRNKEKLAAMIQAAAETSEPRLAVRDPYVFEFLGIKPSEVMGESSLEDALLDRLQDFLLELGHGFCFEARQRRIIIGDTFGFVDLVFYHRVLKCHVLVELKVGRFAQCAGWLPSNLHLYSDGY
jgi:predicted nuclease of restriction endonuclease-like (RecB) superfamily